MRKLLFALLMVGTVAIDLCNANEPQEDKGLIIAAFGLTGSGKSSTMRKLHKITHTTLLDEPETENWPQYTTQAELMDPFTFLMDFEAIRVAHLRLADKLRSIDKNVLLAPYYQKAHTFYLGERV